ncbi:MAG: hypothetical protein HXY34_11110 [Candidatus Thorarchaeota archaeon]|nr:hypothetical protein [Candidatus Thorarchaeota archaeon]
MKQGRLTDVVRCSDDETPHADACKDASVISSTRMIEIDEKRIENDPLWPILVETAKRSPLYPGLSAYTSGEILPHSPDITPRELAGRLSISIGEALVILSDLKKSSH